MAVTSMMITTAIVGSRVGGVVDLRLDVHLLRRSIAIASGIGGGGGAVRRTIRLGWPVRVVAVRVHQESEEVAGESFSRPHAKRKPLTNQCHSFGYQKVVLPLRQPNSRNPDAGVFS